MTTWVQILPLPLISSLTWDKLFDFFESQYLYLLNGEKEAYFAGML